MENGKGLVEKKKNVGFSLNRKGRRRRTRSNEEEA